MPGVSAEQVKCARRMDLLTYLQTYEPYELKPDGPGRYTTVTHGSLVISRGKWIWNRTGDAGASALDYLIKVRGMGFVEAVEQLTGERAAVVPAIPPQAKPPAPEERRPFRPPKPLRYATQAVAYLQNRGIHPDLLRQCLQDGTLYEARHNGEAVCVFVGKDQHGKERFACMRSIVGNLKQDASGSDKAFGFHLPARHPKSRHLAVFESPIDALSHATIQMREGWDWDGFRLSLGGTSPTALISFLEWHPQIQRVALALDNDVAGQTAMQKIQALLTGDERFAHIRTTINPPKAQKDYNAALLHAIRLEREQKQQCRPADRAADFI